MLKAKKHILDDTSTSRKIILDRAAFEIALAKSSSPEDIALLYHCNLTTVFRAIKRFGMMRPNQWGKNSAAALEKARPTVPDVIILREIDRAWSASLFGGEGSITANYDERYNKTFLVTLLRMSDKNWVDHFAQLVGFTESGERRKGKYKTQWDKTLVGKRALRFLIEILPYLYGSKKAEAIRAIEFFSPKGYRFGRYSSLEIWPPSEFPLRKRPLSGKPNRGRPKKHIS